MRQRYCHSMTNIAPSPEFLRRLEQDMNRELRARPSKMPLIAASAAALVVLTLVGTVTLQPHPDVVQRNNPSGPLSPSTANPTDTKWPTEEPSASPQPSSTPTNEEPSTAPQPSPTPANEEARMELEMSEKDVLFFNRSIDENGYQDLVMYNQYLIGAAESITGNPYANAVVIHESSDPDSRVVGALLPGMAHWPVDLGKTDAAQRTVWLDESRNVLRDGYILPSDDPTPSSMIFDNPVEHVYMFGRVKDDEAVLRYGRYEDAPAVAAIPKDQILGLGFRVGNWIYASNECFLTNGAKPATGWIHISQVKGYNYRHAVNSVELLGDNVNVRAQPGGKIIATLPQNTTNIYYTGVTQTTKSGRWHLVRFGGNAEKGGYTTGFIFADYACLSSVHLANLINLENVASATLAYGENAPFGRASQTIEGERLSLLKERLYGALSVSTYESVCGEGTATLTLSYPDGTQEILPISGDGCTHLCCGDVKYDLRTEEERAYAWQNDGGAGMSDILSPIFDEIKIP